MLTASVLTRFTRIVRSAARHVRSGRTLVLTRLNAAANTGSGWQIIGSTSAFTRSRKNVEFRLKRWRSCLLVGGVKSAAPQNPCASTTRMSTATSEDFFVVAAIRALASSVMIPSGYGEQLCIWHSKPDIFEATYEEVT